jgi:hypothetical protein
LSDTPLPTKEELAEWSWTVALLASASGLDSRVEKMIAAAEFLRDPRLVQALALLEAVEWVGANEIQCYHAGGGAWCAGRHDGKTIPDAVNSLRTTLEAQEKE